MRDLNCFWEVYKKPRYGEVYNIGGGRYSNCSVIEALDLVEEIAKIKMPDLNCYDVQAAMKIVAGTARSMGVLVEGM